MRVIAGRSYFVLSGLLLSCTAEPSIVRPDGSRDVDRDSFCLDGKCDYAADPARFDYIVVGSGAGGGPLASRLARAGFHVLLLEAGEDTGGNVTYQVPALNLQAVEDPDMRWDYYVRHHDDEAQAVRDTKMVYDEDETGAEIPRGILYPRTGTLGGCTAHNALITMYPHASDWNYIAQLTGDGSWSAPNMREHFVRLEQNHYLGPLANRRGHGFDGWLGVEMLPASLALADGKVVNILKGGIQAYVEERVDSSAARPSATLRELTGLLNSDVNALDHGPGREGAFTVPLATQDGRRNGPREFILETIAEGYPLTVRPRSLVTNVIFHDRPNPAGEPVAAGVEFMDGRHLYRADPATRAGEPPPPKTAVHARREVILSAGAFNTPQLLMLSGIGPRDHLEELGIAVRLDLPGVGGNLQDRYEVGIVYELDRDFRSLRNCTFGQAGDRCLERWERGRGPYLSNGIAAGIVRRSPVAGIDPDLFIFGTLGNFRGYYPGFAEDAVRERNYFTWAILKGHTRNRAGRVSLRSDDPRDWPDISFRYFEEGGEADLDAMVEAVRFVRRIEGHADRFMPFDDMTEVWPGADVQSDEEIEQFVRDESWGHHACCTNPIGSDDDPMAVLDSEFRVRGTERLRVVDASVFPRIPGFFIVVPIYVVSEKAAISILEDARAEPPRLMEW